MSSAGAVAHQQFANFDDQFPIYTAPSVGIGQPSGMQTPLALDSSDSVRREALRCGGFLDVWSRNVDGAFALLRRHLSEGYHHVAMDTEFPGVVAKPVGDIKEYAYQCVKCNVDLLKLIQVGISLFDENGNSPEIHTWQFNFKFKIDEDMYAQDSIELLKNAGINFVQHQTDGIEVMKFARLLITSGLVLLPDVTWISFHSIYDFGYLLKILTNTQLPPTEAQFFEILRLYFSSFYDIKLLIDSNQSFKGGLQELAMKYNIERVGLQHQAGSDALLTGKVFFALRRAELTDDDSVALLHSQLFGLNSSQPAALSTNCVHKTPTKNTSETADVSQILDEQHRDFNELEEIINRSAGDSNANSLGLLNET